MKTIVKNIALSALLLAMVIPVKAQRASGGIIGAMSTGKIEISDIKEEFTDAIEGTNILGYEAGIFGIFSVGSFYVKPQLLYTVRDGEVNYVEKGTGDLPGVSRTADFKLERFETPVLLGFSILGPFLGIEVGPVYNYVVNATETFNGNEIRWAKHGVSYRAGLASEFGPLLLQAGYQGLTDISRSNRITYSEPYKMYFGVGFTLGSTER